MSIRNDTHAVRYCNGHLGQYVPHSPSVEPASC
nr:MAG TPA: hypothetical protein [Caudoviricetes sp.]